MIETKITEALGRHRSAQPFEPFELVFHDGKRAPITTPEGVGWHASSDQLSYAADDDSFIHTTLSEVADVRMLAQHETGAAT